MFELRSEPCYRGVLLTLLLDRRVVRKARRDGVRYPGGVGFGRDSLVTCRCGCKARVPGSVWLVWG